MHCLQFDVTAERFAALLGCKAVAFTARYAWLLDFLTATGDPLVRDTCG